MGDAKRKGGREESRNKQRFFARLAELGHEDYKSYLKSEHWQSFRRKVFMWERNCRSCGEKSEVVHHTTYRRIGREDIDDVVALCLDCHERIHDVHKNLGIRLIDFAKALAIVNPGKSVPAKPERAKQKKAKKPKRPKGLPYIDPVPAAEASPDAIMEHPLFSRRRIVAARFMAGATIESLAREMKCSRTHMEQLAAWMAANEPAAIPVVPDSSRQGPAREPRKEKRARTRKPQARNQGPSNPVALRMIARTRGM